MTLSVPLLREAPMRFPRVRLHLVESMSGFLLDMVERGQVTAPSRTTFRHSRKCRSQRWGARTFCTSQLPALARNLGGKVGLRDLATLPLFLPGLPHSLRHLVDAVAANEAIDLNVIAEVDATSSIKRPVADGLGCSILSRHAVRHATQAGELAAITIDGARLCCSVQLGANLRRITDPTMRGVSRLIVERFQSCWDEASATGGHAEVA